jgi:hypothetical protein
VAAIGVRGGGGRNGETYHDIRLIPEAQAIADSETNLGREARLDDDPSGSHPAARQQQRLVY